MSELFQQVASFANLHDAYLKARRAGFQTGSTRTKTLMFWAYASSSNGRLIGMTADTNDYKWQDFTYSAFMFGDNSFYNERGDFTGMDTNAWKHVAVTVDINQATTSRVKVYLNGSSLAVTWSNDTGNPYYDGSDLNLYLGAIHLGVGNGGIQSFFSGRLDDVRIYKRALTAKEIEAIYNATR